MIIVSKFNSICPICNQTIESGSKIEWKKGSKAIHEQCHINQLKEEKDKRDAEQEAKRIRFGDKIEVLEDLYHYGLFGNLEPELMCPKGVKAKIRTENTIFRKINGKKYECVQCEEINVRNGKPKSKSGFFIVPFEMMNIIKKAK